MTTLTINIGEPLFSFRSKQDWINKGPEIWRRHRANERNAISIDQKGRIVQMGHHFARAEADGSYPITVYRMQADGGTVTEQATATPAAAT